MKLLFPEPLFNIEQLSFSTFLYFQEEEIASTLHPTVSIFTTGCDPFYFSKMVENSNANWKNQFDYVFNLWNMSNQMFHKASDLVKPLQKNSLRQFGFHILTQKKH